MKRETIGPMRKLEYSDGYATPEFVKASRTYLFIQLGAWRDMGYFVQLTTLPNAEYPLWQLQVNTHERVYTAMCGNITDAIQEILDDWVDVPLEDNQNSMYQMRKREREDVALKAELHADIDAMTPDEREIYKLKLQQYALAKGITL